MRTRVGEYLDQLYAAFPSDSKPSFPVETVAFSKCLMFIDDLADVTIINIDNQTLRNSCLEKTYHDFVIGALMKKPILEKKKKNENNGRKNGNNKKNCSRN